MVLTEKMELSDLLKLNECTDGFLKIDIDIKRKKVAACGMIHGDMMWEMLDDGSDQNDIFGADIYPDGSIVWESMLNIRQNAKIRNGTIGRILTDENTIFELTEIINLWIWR